MGRNEGKVVEVLPHIELAGGVVAAPEVRFAASSGKAWATVRVACKESKRGADGSWTDGESTFLTVILFGKQAENLAESVRVGDQIVVSGHLQQKEWTDGDGNKRTSYEVVADEVGVSLRWNEAKTARALEDSSSVVRTPAGQATFDDPWSTPQPKGVVDPPF